MGSGSREVYLDKEFIGKKLKEYRKKSGFTQDDVSNKAGIDEKHYGKLERGIFFPSIETFFKLIEILNIPLDDFGLKINNLSNKKREELVKLIYMSENDEIEAFADILKTLRKLRTNSK